MENIKGISVSSLPFEPLQKVCDLMEYDGPLLSHYKDSKNKNYFFYWVDYNENYNRWLAFQVDNNLLFDYLNKSENLLSLIKDNSYIFCFDVNIEIEYKNIKMIHIEDIPVAYLPDSDSFYQFEIPQLYIQNLATDSPNEYLKIMRENGIHFSLKSTNPKYSKAVKMGEAGKFLIEIAESTFEYAKADFFNKYKDDFTDVDKLNKTVNSLKKAIEPLIFDTHFNSFDVLINIDSVMSYEGESNKYKTWRKSLIDNYHKDIINIDYTSDKALESISKKFPDENLRKKIIKPIIDILVKTDYRFETKKRNENKQTHKPISKKRYKELIPSQIDPNESTEKKKILNVIVEMTEKDGVLIFNKKDFPKNVLFQKEEPEVELSINYASWSNTEVIFKEPLKYKYSIDEDNLNHILCNDFDIDLHGHSKSDVLRSFQKNIIETILAWIESNINLHIIEKYVEEVRMF